MTKLRVPMWTVYVSKDSSLHAYDTYAVDKPPARAKDHIIGYVNFKKKQQAIDYCIDMGYENSYKTDHVPMRPWQRGEILFYYSTRQLSLLRIAEKTNRSIDWVQIVCGIQGRARQELINMYMEVKDEESSNRSPIQPRKSRAELNMRSTVTKKTDRVRVQGTPKRSTTKKVHNQRTKRPVPDYRVEGRGNGVERKQRANNSNSSGKQGIADNLRKSKDYKGE